MISEDQVEMPKYWNGNWGDGIWALQISKLAKQSINDGSYLMIPVEPQYGGIVLSANFMKDHNPKPGGYYVILGGRGAPVYIDEHQFKNVYSSKPPSHLEDGDNPNMPSWTPSASDMKDPCIVRFFRWIKSFYTSM